MIYEIYKVKRKIGKKFPLRGENPRNNKKALVKDRICSYVNADMRAILCQIPN